MKLDPKALDAAAKAMYDFQVTAAIDQINHINFDASDIGKFFLRIKNESETSIIMVTSSFIEEKISYLIKSRLKHLNSTNEEERIFGNNGPFSTLSNKIDLSYHLGWISEDTKKKMTAFRKIRNEFAHNAFKIDFDNKKIKSLYQSLRYDIFKFKNLMCNVQELKVCEFIDDSDIGWNNELIFSLANLASSSIKEFLVMPSAVEKNIAYESILQQAKRIPSLNHLNTISTITFLSTVIKDFEFKETISKYDIFNRI